MPLTSAYVLVEAMQKSIQHLTLNQRVGGSRPPRRTGQSHSAAVAVLAGIHTRPESGCTHSALGYLGTRTPECLRENAGGTMFRLCVGVGQGSSRPAAIHSGVDQVHRLERQNGMKQTKDKPGTIRTSPQGDWAFLTTDTDEAPWFHIDPDGRRYFATDEDVQDWAVRDSC